MRTPLVLAAAASLGVTAAPRLAEACSLFQNVDYVIQPSTDDVVPPSAVTVTEVAVDHYWMMEQDTCPDLAWINFVLAATDDRGVIAYDIAVASGTPPSGFTLPPGPVGPSVLGTFFFYISPYEAVDFELSVRAVDFSGNRGEPTIFRVTAPAGEPPPRLPDEPDEAGGCSTTGAPPLAAALALLALLGRGRLTRRAAQRR